MTCSPLLVPDWVTGSVMGRMDRHGILALEAILLLVSRLNRHLSGRICSFKLRMAKEPASLFHNAISTRGLSVAG